MTTLSTHILDISTGKPAAGVALRLEQGGQVIASGLTNANGRLGDFAPAPLPPGRYRLVAETGDWFAAKGLETPFPCAQIDFVIPAAADEHYHLPFLIAPGGWSTYRGS